MSETKQIEIDELIRIVEEEWSNAGMEDLEHSTWLKIIERIKQQ